MFLHAQSFKQMCPVPLPPVSWLTKCPSFWLRHLQFIHCVSLSLFKTAAKPELLFLPPSPRSPGGQLLEEQEPTFLQQAMRASLCDFCNCQIQCHTRMSTLQDTGTSAPTQRQRLVKTSVFYGILQLHIRACIGLHTRYSAIHTKTNTRHRSWIGKCGPIPEQI